MGNTRTAEQPGGATGHVPDEGRAAFADGQNERANPYSVAMEPWSRHRWIEGFAAARQAPAMTDAAQ